MPNDRVIAIAGVRAVGERPPATVHVKRLALVLHTLDTATKEVDEDLIYLDYQANDTETQQDIYRLLLQLRWLPQKLRNCVRRELGGSPQEEKRRAEKDRRERLYFQVDQLAEQKRKNGERGFMRAALDEVATTTGQSFGAVEKRYKRHKKNLRSRK